MTTKNPVLHGKFATWLLKQVQLANIDKRTFYDIIRITKDGVYPEGADMSDVKNFHDAQQAQADGIAALNLPPMEAINRSLDGKDARLDRAVGREAEPTRAGQLYTLGHTSLTNLQGVLPALVTMAKLAIQVTKQDFGITDGVRTIEEQAAMVKRGVSRTMQSKHLRQPDGFSHAIDATPFVNGKPTWDWQYIYFVATAMDQAARSIGIAEKIRWGGAWDRRLSDFNSDPDIFRAAVLEYRDRHPGKDFLDGPHYEWAE